MKKRNNKKELAFYGWVLILISIFIFISLVSYNPDDLSRNGRIRNLTGILGAFLSRFLLSNFSIISYILVLIILFVGFVLIFKKLRRKLFPHILLYSLFFLFLFFIFDILKIKFAGFPIAGLLIHNTLIYLSRFLGRTGLFIILLGLELGIVFSIFDVSVILPKLKLRKRKKTILPVETLEEENFSYEDSFSQREKFSQKEEMKQEQSVESGADRVDKIERNVSAEEDEPFLFSKEQFLQFLTFPSQIKGVSSSEIKSKKEKLIKKLREFNIKGNITHIKTGPFITRFEFKPAAGEKIQSIVKLADDLALELGVGTISIVGPQQGKDVLGIEVPNEKIETVFLRKLLQSQEYEKAKGELVFPVGTDIEGNPVVWDVVQFPHLLIAGTTGSGKSVFLNSLVISLLYNNTYNDLRLILIDPKRIEMQFYNFIPHLLMPVVVDSKEAVDILDYAVRIMEERYKDFSRHGVRNITEFNEKSKEKKPHILIVVDELADLMMTSSRDVERGITRLAQMARAVGIHLILATQRPSVDVITGIIKANFPSRIAFKVSSKVDSKVILDTTGAERLLGRGDLLFLPYGRGEYTRLHAPYISADEVRNICKYFAKIHLYSKFSSLLSSSTIKQIVDADLLEGVIFKDEKIYDIKRKKMKVFIGEDNYNKIMERGFYPSFDEVEYSRKIEGEYGFKVDELFGKAARLVFEMGAGSATLLQRRFAIGWARASKIVDQLEVAGILGKPERGGKPRKILVKSEEELQEKLKNILG